MSNDTDNPITKVAPTGLGVTLAETIESIKNGSAFKDASAALQSISEVASSLPASIGNQLATLQADIAAKMSEAQKSVSKDLSIAKANLSLQNTLSIENTGTPLSNEEQKSAIGSLSILSEGPKMLAEKASSLVETVGGFATKFGASMPDGLSPLDIAKSAGSAISSFVNSIPTAPVMPEAPAETVTVGAVTLANPNYADEMAAYTAGPLAEYTANQQKFTDEMTQFTADPINIEKSGFLNDVSGAITGAVTDITSSFSTITNKAAAATQEAISNLKAFALANKLANPLSGPLGDAISNGMNLMKVSPLDITKAMTRAASVEPTTFQPFSPRLSEVKLPNIDIFSSQSSPGESVTSEMVDSYKRKVDAAKESAIATSAISDTILESDAAFQAAKSALNEYRKTLPQPPSTWTADQTATHESLALRAKAEKTRVMEHPSFTASAEALDVYSKYLDGYYELKGVFEENGSINDLTLNIKKELGLV